MEVVKEREKCREINPRGPNENAQPNRGAGICCHSTTAKSLHNINDKPMRPALLSKLITLARGFYLYWDLYIWSVPLTTLAVMSPSTWTLDR